MQLWLAYISQLVIWILKNRNNYDLTVLSEMLLGWLMLASRLIKSVFKKKKKNNIPIYGLRKAIQSCSHFHIQTQSLSLCLLLSANRSCWCKPLRKHAETFPERETDINCSHESLAETQRRENLATKTMTIIHEFKIQNLKVLVELYDDKTQCRGFQCITVSAFKLLFFFQRRWQ